MEGVRALDAVVLIVKDLEAQVRFYRDVLGLKVIGDYGDAVFFSCGRGTLALFTRDHHPEGTRSLEGAPKGISHLEFRIAAHEYEEMKRRLTEAGFHAYREVFRDADGNLFHFNLDR